MPNTNYNINTFNKKLVLTYKTVSNKTFTVIPDNYTLTSFMNALNTLFKACTTVSFKSIVT